MQKTVREWLEELPEPYRSQALENYDNHALSYSSEPVCSLASAVFCSFNWADTPQGKGYWTDFHTRLYQESFKHTPPTPTERQTAEALLKEFGDYMGYAYNNDSINQKVITDFLTSKYGKG